MTRRVDERLLALVHSPLTGPSTWRLTEQALRAAGVPATAVDYGGVAGPDWYGGVAMRLQAAIDAPDPVILVAHSGAGGLAPSALEALGERAAGFILVDAVMPHPGRRWLDTAHPLLARRLDGLAVDGMLPTWDLWFSADAFAGMVTNPLRRAEFSADLPRIPFEFLEARAPATDRWRRLAGAYVQLSRTYDAEASAAAALGWRVRREVLGHLAMLNHPERLARIITKVAREL
jgi:hypothetical protein